MGDLLTGINKNEKILAVFIDLKKAFDTVDHDLILRKLERYGIDGRELSWFNSYLSNRSQYTNVNGCESVKCSIITGVPQGSLLGVLLFQILINDLHRAIRYSSSILYADDTTIYLSGTNLRCVKAKLQYDISQLYEWLCANNFVLECC